MLFIILQCRDWKNTGVCSHKLVGQYYFMPFSMITVTIPAAKGTISLKKQKQCIVLNVLQLTVF